jgi:hypothetical protein
MQSNKISIYIVLSHFLANYHSGQWSRGYRYLSISLKRLNRIGITHPLDYNLTSTQKRLYNHLVKCYSQDV